ncbi:MAG: hypothetical protein FWF46_09640 [Oscillospiraceae bacterium]|nr:hypothetical protein [Oscillospiraceae bacterium]
MALFNDELNKTAVMMANIINQLNQLNVETEFDVINKHNELCVLAYFIRVGILDRIEKNKWSLMYPIAIPTGLFGVNKTTIANGLDLTVGKIKEIAKRAYLVENDVEEVLKKEEYFWIVDRELSPEVKAKI